VKTFRRYLPLLCLTVLPVPVVSAQSSVDFYGGAGTAHAKSSVIDIIGDGTLYRTPSLGGVFIGFGGNVMLNQRFGIGSQVSFQPNRPDYSFLQSRTTFWDAHGIYQPFTSTRASLQLQGGIGVANVRFYLKDAGCNGITGCSSSTQFLDSSNHFQMRAGAGVQVFLTERLFVRPQVDLRYVPNFFQYGSNFVPGAMVWVGYSIGDR
jgi:opacity protein-like surface antigen